MLLLAQRADVIKLIHRNFLVKNKCFAKLTFLFRVYFCDRTRVSLGNKKPAEAGCEYFVLNFKIKLQGVQIQPSMHIAFQMYSYMEHQATHTH